MMSLLRQRRAAKRLSIMRSKENGLCRDWRNVSMLIAGRDARQSWY